jgi:hypothetical protein
MSRWRYGKWTSWAGCFWPTGARSSWSPDDELRSDWYRWFRGEPDTNVDYSRKQQRDLERLKRGDFYPSHESPRRPTAPKPCACPIRACESGDGAVSRGHLIVAITWIGQAGRRTGRTPSPTSWVSGSPPHSAIPGELPLGRVDQCPILGAEWGAATLGQPSSDTVIVTLRRPLTWANTVTWPVRLTAHSVRIEGPPSMDPPSG